MERKLIDSLSTTQTLGGLVVGKLLVGNWSSAALTVPFPCMHHNEYGRAEWQKVRCDYHLWGRVIFALR